MKRSYRLNQNWAFQVPASEQAELNEFEKTLAQFKAGTISDAQFRAIRVPMGIYEQRESGTYMLRVRLPAGGVLPEHLRHLGTVSSKFGNGVLHVTTRQEFQVHRVSLDSIMPALYSLAAAGLSTKGGGGNTVRNITACFDSGACRHEIFDAAPYAIALTEHLMPDPLSFRLPRKYKIAFAACSRDCSGATVSDIGFVAKRQNGVNGFAVYVAGGLGGKSRVASLLHEFIPAGDAFQVAEAVKRVFDKNGDRKNKHLARLRFLVARIGLAAFRNLYEKELAALRASVPAPLPVRPYPGENRSLKKPAQTASTEATEAFSRWLACNVTAQKQPGFFLVHVPLVLGDLPATKADRLADIVAEHGEGILCATQSQNVVLRWVSKSELPVLREKLDAMGLATPEAPVLRNLVSCAGASTCRLGICLSRGLAKAIRRELSGSKLPLERLGDLTIHVSGCPNSCGRHPIGNIGLSGAARQIDGRLVPHYAVQLGGRLGEGATRLGTNVGAAPARNVPAFIHDLLTIWQQSADSTDFHRFIENGGKAAASELIERHRQMPTNQKDKEFFFDWDSESEFSLSGRGAGECSAGAFDLIEVDLANARESLEAGRLYEAALSAARALLVTRDLQAKSDGEVFRLFQRHFVLEQTVDVSLTEVIAAGMLAAATPMPANRFDGKETDVTTLVASVRLLYENMEASLRVKPATRAT